MKTGMDTTAPLCAILFLREETSEAGPLAIWEPNWLNQGREHNGEYRQTDSHDITDLP